MYVCTVTQCQTVTMPTLTVPAITRNKRSNVKVLSHRISVKISLQWLH